MELSAARHGCKVCGKSFPCGRSLGGHMRSHLSLGEAAAAAAEVDADNEPRRVSVDGGRSSNGVVGYGLRENPRKTRRLSDFVDEEEKGDGGDGDADGEDKACRECGKLFASWRSLFGHMRSHAFGGRDRDEEEDVDVEGEFGPEEAEAEEVEVVTPMQAPAPAAVPAAAPRRRRRSMIVAAPASAPPPVLSGFEKEQEDVALCLLMLSRDTGLWSAPVKEEPFEKEISEHKMATAKHAHLPRNGYAYNSDDDSAPLQYGGAKIKSGVGKSRKRSSPKQQCEAAVATKRTRYECPGCGKVFSSYQALGGHRASHKRINTSCSAPKAAAAPAPAPEPSAETYTSFSTLSPSASPDSVAIGMSKATASAAAEAAKKKFASGQALGRHKRSHVTADDDGEELYTGGADQKQQSAAAAAGFLDLNFPPAPPVEA